MEKYYNLNCDFIYHPDYENYENDLNYYKDINNVFNVNLQINYIGFQDKLQLLLQYLINNNELWPIWRPLIEESAISIYGNNLIDGLEHLFSMNIAFYTNKFINNELNANELLDIIRQN